MIQQAAYTSNKSDLHQIIKDLKDQNKKLLETIKKLVSNKENLPPKKPNQQHNTQSKRLWLYYYSCGANKDHESPECTSK